MKAAFATWGDRIAPLFDAARQIQIVQMDSGRIVCQSCDQFIVETPPQKVLHLAELGIDVVVCGAITKPLHAMLCAQGLRVISFVSGDLKEVIQALRSGKISDICYAMPGHRVVNTSGKMKAGRSNFSSNESIAVGNQRY
ncbi:MAG: hypothetical protein M0036_09350 [Desulfobacteraceae bacterium]|nr:hypothetical protein [Desulfobacteraceae bacterium]